MATNVTEKVPEIDGSLYRRIVISYVAHRVKTLPTRSGLKKRINIAFKIVLK